MLTIYATTNDKTTIVEEFQEGVWINLVNPQPEEITKVAEKTGIYCDLIKAALDSEERPRVETEDNQMLIILNVPVIRNSDVIYNTLPLGVVITDKYFVTVSLEESIVLREFCDFKIKGLATFKKTRFLFMILYKTASLYLRYLRDINKKTDDIELELHKSMKNRELIRLLNLEKSLVYFTTSLKSNQIVMEKLLKSSYLKKYHEDEDLLEDVIIENQQAIEMANIYTNILSGTMDAFASIISNNLNMVMKFLAGITIVLALPTMVASFFGMNVTLPFQASPNGFTIVIGISFLLSVLATWYLAKKKML